VSSLKTDLFIDGAYAPAASGRRFATVNPATGETIAEVAEAGKADLDRAVASARKAFESGPWAAMKPRQRGRILTRAAELLLSRADEFGNLETQDNGKPIFEAAKIDMPAAAECLSYFGEYADKLYGDTYPPRPDAFLMTMREPVGVVGAITPWNFPLLQAMWKIAPALALGNAVVLKPASATPLTALLFAELLTEAGLPPGAFQVVPGPGPVVGQAMAEHPGIDKISFTGETETGKAILRAAAGTVKRVSMELGGKSPNVVFADADLDQAVFGAVSGIFAATGQTCIAGSRLLVQDSIYDSFVEKLVGVARTARMGDPMDPATQVGPVTTPPQFAKVLEYIDVARQEGATLLLGGQRGNAPECGGGWFVQPTIFGDVRNDMRIAQEEVFGPVLSIIRFKDEEDALRIANDVRFGLAAAVWTSDIGRALRMSEKLQAGTVWVNTYRAISYLAPFGGYKDSGLGRENGIDAIREYLQVKSVWINSGAVAGNPFVMR